MGEIACVVLGIVNMQLACAGKMLDCQDIIVSAFKIPLLFNKLGAAKWPNLKKTSGSEGGGVPNLANWPEIIYASGSGGPKGGHLKGRHLKMGFRTEIRTRHVEFALKFALDTSILIALSKATPQGKCRLDDTVR